MKGVAKCKAPRRMGPVARAYAQMLNDYGVTEVMWGKKKHGFVVFEIDGVVTRLSFACTPRDDARAVKIGLVKLEAKILDAIAEGLLDATVESR